jgi:hypothetical protein
MDELESEPQVVHLNDQIRFILAMSESLEETFRSIAYGMPFINREYIQDAIQHYSKYSQYWEHVDIVLEGTIGVWVAYGEMLSLLDDEPSDEAIIDKAMELAEQCRLPDEEMLLANDKPNAFSDIDWEEI